MHQGGNEIAMKKWVGAMRYMGGSNEIWVEAMKYMGGSNKIYGWEQ